MVRIAYIIFGSWFWCVNQIFITSTSSRKKKGMKLKRDQKKSAHQGEIERKGKEKERIMSTGSELKNYFVELNVAQNIV